MRKKNRGRASKVGLEPGTLIYTGDHKVADVSIQLIEYDHKGYFEERSTTNLLELAEAIDSSTITWINVVGLHDVATIEKIGQAFGIHPLLLEDTLNTEQRPKIEPHNDYLFIIARMLYWHEAEKRVVTEQISIVLGRNYVLTFQENEEDVFNQLRLRLRDGRGRDNQSGADYLAYAILDAVVDNYFIALEHIGDEIDALEDELVGTPTSDTLQAIHALKRELLYLRKSVWPLRELLSTLQHGDNEFFNSSTLIYLRDVYEHTIQAIDTLETFRDVAASMLDIYLSSVSNKMNEIMKVLTVIATIFIPMTFITSLYGMNFDYMPELHWYFGYPAVWVANIVIAVGMLLYFKRRGWL